MKFIGIDAGGSLTKVAYHEKGQLHLKTYPNHEMTNLVGWLQMITPRAHLHLTGGKSVYLQQLTTLNSHVVDEFQALVDGTRFLLQEEKIYLKEHFILVSVGTGTSIFYVTRDHFERLLGSGIGGGTFMGLGKIISGKQRFQDLIELSQSGNHKNSNLLVKDIYHPNEPPLLGNLTASNFGKAHLNEDVTCSDHMAALVQLIGEILLQLANQAALMKEVKKIVFVGSTLNNNTSLINVLKSFEDMMQYDPIFLNRGSHAGAIGALMK